MAGRHDVTAFCAVACEAASPVETLDRLHVARMGDLVRVVAETRSVLHRPSCTIVGTLTPNGEGRWTVDTLAAALAARGRTLSGRSARR